MAKTAERRGGVRKGAGRKKQYRGELVPLTIRVNEGHRNALLAFAADKGLASESEAVRLLIETTLAEWYGGGTDEKSTIK